MVPRWLAYATLFAAAWLLPINSLYAKGGGHGGGGHGGGGHHGGEHDGEHHEAHHEEHHAEHHEGEHHEGEHHEGEHHDGEHHLNTRPNWNNLNHEQHATTHDNVRNAVNHRDGDHDMHQWLDHHPDRHEHYHHWARHDHHHGHHHGWDHHHWWHHHFPVAHHWWNYNHYWNHYPWNAWWTAPTWAAIADWFPGYNWTEPVYYDYGDGGNVVQDNTTNTTYINGQNAGSNEDYAKSAAQLATVDPPANDEENANTEWLPLGNFSLSTNEEDTEPSRVLQLAVNKQGIISGMLYNETTDKSLPVQGQVDPETQRVAFRIGGNRQVVFETGIYNLTQEEAPVQIHFGTQRVQNGLLVRLETPPSEDDGEGTSL